MAGFEEGGEGGVKREEEGAATDHFSEVWAAELGNDSTDSGCL